MLTRCQSLFVNDIFGGNPDGVLAYAQAYVVNTTALPSEVSLGISSDDSVQVLLNGEEVWFHSMGRAGADACEPQDTSPDGGVKFNTPHVLVPGENSLIVKVWEGFGEWNFALRFQDSNGEPITEGLAVRKTPEGICAVPPLGATRSIDPGETVLVECRPVAGFSTGATYNVTLEISNPRTASAACPAASTATLVETVPAGWTPTPGSASNSGVVAGETVTWSLSVPFPPSLSYRVRATGNQEQARFTGRITEPGNLATFIAGGTSLLVEPGSYSELGFIRDWLLLGPFRQPLGIGWGAAPSVTNLRRDLLTDGAAITEATVEPAAGETVNTAFGGASPSPGLAPPATPNGINPGGVPTWKAWRDRDDTIDFNNYYGGDVNRIVMYAVVYISVESEVTVDVGLASDESVQVFLDGEEIFFHIEARTAGASNTVQNVIDGATTPGLSPLTAGVHRLMVKVFEGTDLNSFRLRFQEPITGEPVTEGITICLDRNNCPPTPAVELDCTNGQNDDGDTSIDCADLDCDTAPACQRPTFHRGDPYNTGNLVLTNGVAILNFLFLGGSRPLCREAADVNNDGAINLTDGITVFNFLFLGGTPPADPGPTSRPCGPDPDPAGGPKDLGCETYDHCG